MESLRALATRPPALPIECLQKIFSYLQANSLHSCQELDAQDTCQDQDDVASLRAALLVNRTWCQIVAPMLWRRPFNHRPSKTGRWLIAVYINFLTNEQRLRLNIMVPSVARTPSFDYPSFLRELHYQELYVAIKDWLDSCGASSLRSRHADPVPCIRLPPLNAWTDSVNGDFDGKRASEIGFEICNMFLSRCPTFDLLCLGTTRIADRWGEVPTEHVAIPTFPAARRSLAQLWGFVCSGSYEKRGIFDEMAGYCRDIEVLTADGISTSDKCVHASLAQLIRNQRKLEIFILCRCDETDEILPALESQMSTLRYLQFTECWFASANPLCFLETQDNGVRQLEFSDCNFSCCSPSVGDLDCRQLETLRFLHCQDVEWVVQAFQYVPLPQLACLELISVPCQDTLVEAMFRQAGNSLREVKVSANNGREYPATLIDSLAQHCPNVNVVHAYLDREAVLHLPVLYRAAQQLQELVLEGDVMPNETDIVDYSDSLPEGNVVPAGLRVLSIFCKCMFKPFALRIFLSRCRAELKTLVLYTAGNDNDNDMAVRTYARERRYELKRTYLGNSINVGKLQVDFDG